MNALERAFYNTYNALLMYYAQYWKLQATRNLNPVYHLSFLEILPQSRQTADATMFTGPTRKNI